MLLSSELSQGLLLTSSFLSPLETAAAHSADGRLKNRYDVKFRICNGAARTRQNVGLNQGNLKTGKYCSGLQVIDFCPNGIFMMSISH